MICHLIQSFLALPQNLQVQLIGNFITVGGTLITAIVSLIIVILTISHNRKAKQKELEMNLRKEIYLDAAAAINAAMSAVGNLAGLTETYESAMKEFNEKRAAFSKILLIGNLTLINAQIDFENELLSNIMDLHIKRQPLVAEQAEIEMLSTVTNEAARSELKTRKANLRSSQIQFILSVIDVVNHLHELIIPVTLAARNELGIEIDSDAFRKSYIEKNKAIGDKLRQAISNIPG